MEKKRKLYISLPITGKDIKEVRMQAEYTKSWWSNSFDVVTPFDICGDQDDKPYSWYMGKDVEALLECDAIFMCPGWINSKGCNAEFQIAKIYGLEIIG